MASTETHPADVVDPAVKTATLEKEIDEKVDAIDIDVQSIEPDLDLYVPLKMDGGIIDDRNPLTIRAVLVGIVLGCLVNASNLYLGKFSRPTISFSYALS